MIQAMVIKLIFKAVMNKINEKHNLRKIDDYVNKPNDLDKQMKQVQKNSTNNAKDIEEMWKDIAILKTDSHPQADWICMKCGCKARRVEKPTIRKRRRKRR